MKKKISEIGVLENGIKHWCMSLVIGLMLIAVGIFVFVYPTQSYEDLAIFFSLTLLATGAFESMFALFNTKVLDTWMWHLISGLISFVLGAFLFFNVGTSMEVLPFFIGFSLLFNSAYVLGLAFDFKGKDLPWSGVAISSVIGILVSLLLIASPAFAVDLIVVATGIAFIGTGVAFASFGLLLKKLGATCFVCKPKEDK